MNIYDCTLSNPIKTQHPEASWCDMLAGAIAGGIGSYVTNPLDVLKTRLQTDSSKYHGSIITCATDTWQEGGGMAFLRGSVPRLLHKVPANGAFFLFYEFFRRVLHVDGTAHTSSSNVQKGIATNSLQTVIVHLPLQ